LDHLEGAQRIRTGVGPNEFTASEDRDPWVGTPWHKSIPARLEAIPNRCRFTVPVPEVQNPVDRGGVKPGPPPSSHGFALLRARPPTNSWVKPGWSRRRRATPRCSWPGVAGHEREKTSGAGRPRSRLFRRGAQGRGATL